MAITVTPLWIEGLSTHASQDYRKMMEGLCSFKEGLIQSGDFAVTTNNNMTVTVAAGQGFVNGSEDAAQGFYYVHADTNTVISVSAAHATLNRYDMVVIRIRDNFYATGPTNAVDLFVVAGTPASSPAEPTVPANCFVLARLTVTAADVSIASGDIVDRRTTTTSQTGRFGLKGAFRPCTSTTRPTANLQAYGDFIIETDTGRLLWYDGSGWRQFAAGFAAYVSAYQTTTSQVSTGATFALTPGSWIIQGKCEVANLSTSTNWGFTIQIWDSTAGVQLDKTEIFVGPAGSGRLAVAVMAPLTNTSTKTIQLRALSSVGGANFLCNEIRLWATSVSVIS